MSTILPLSANKPGATSFSVSTFLNRIYRSFLKKKITSVSTNSSSTSTIPNAKRPITTPKKSIATYILIGIVIFSLCYFTFNTLFLNKSNLNNYDGTTIYDEFGNPRVIKGKLSPSESGKIKESIKLEIENKRLEIELEKLKKENENLLQHNENLKKIQKQNYLNNNNYPKEDENLKEFKQKQNKELEDILNENKQQPEEQQQQQQPDEERQQQKEEQKLENENQEREKEKLQIEKEFTTPSSSPSSNTADEEKKNSIIAAFLHAWKGYVTYAWGQDELDPVAKRSKNWAPGGIGMTILDSLDTMVLMGLKSELADSNKWIRENLNFNKHVDISLFETTIRVLGGLVSAYGLTNDPLYSEKAVEIADRLLWAFNSTSGIPYTTVNLQSHKVTNPHWNGGKAVLAEFATLQLEFRYLSHITNNPVYDQKVTKAMDILEKANTNDGLYPIYFSESSGQPSGGRITFGAMGDSAYEYLLKQYLLTSKTEKRYKTMYDRSMKGMIEKLIKTSPSGLVYIAESENGHLIHKFDHLACFTAGMLALGAEGATKDEHMKLAEDLTYTCYQMYHKQPSGLAPELVHFNPDMTAGSPAYYILRPETVESLFYLWRKTKDQKYRDWGWEIFQAIEKHCKVSTGGYAGVRSVTTPFTDKDDTQQSFFLAETLKYLYLLFAEDEALDIDKFVFNTEAHPIPVYLPERVDTANNDRDEKPNFE